MSHQTNSEGMIMNREEFTNIIYDTLMENKQHEQLDLGCISDCEVDASKGLIVLAHNGTYYSLDVAELDLKEVKP